MGRKRSARRRPPTAPTASMAAAGRQQGMSRRRWLGLAGAGALSIAGIAFFRREGGEGGEDGAEVIRATMYASIGCQCCHLWARHLRDEGFDVETTYVKDMLSKKDALGIPVALRSCHTAEIGGYAVEGHVPAAIIKRFLSEQPDDRGLAVPGMPGGSPGMESAPKVAYDVIAFASDGATRVYATA